MNAVEFDKLTHRFDDLTAVDCLTLEVATGEIFGLVGPDGAGKTTTFRCATTVMPPTAGTVRVMGLDVREQTEQVRGRIGYVSQRFSLYGDLTVAENLNFFADIYRVPKATRAKRTAELLDFSRLQPFTSRQAQHLSGGMKQKLALACALIHTPDVLFLDEPTTGVDPVSRRDFWKLLYDLVRDGLTLVVSTPYMDEAERCRRVGLMLHGKLIVCDTPDALKRRLRGELIEARCDPQRTAVELLRDTPEALEVEVFGDALHVAVRSAERDWPRLTERLAEHGVRIVDWRRTAPSLEDVFVSLVTSESEVSEDADA